MRVYPVRPHVGVGTLIILDDRLLLIKRKYDPDAGKWSIPGGHLELGETCVHGAEREALEETGIKVKATKLAGVIDKIEYDAQQKIKFHYVLINYFTEIIQPSAKVIRESDYQVNSSSDALEGKFVHFEEIKNYTITDSLKRLLQQLSLI